MRFFTLAVFVACLLGYSLADSKNETLKISQDGSCGTAVNETCMGSTYGDCCSARGFCGSTNDYCSPAGGCQSSFGSCATKSSFISFDGRCGANDPNHQVCIGSQYGSCCSPTGWCGNGTDYCSVGCQSAYGTCGGNGITVNTNATTTSVSSPVSSSSGSSSSSSPSTSPSSAAAGTSVTNNKESSSSSKTPIILGTVIGILGFLILVGGIAGIWYVYRRKSRQPDPAHLVSDDSMVDSKGYHPYGSAPVYEAPHRSAPVEIGARYSVAELQGKEAHEKASPVYQM